jgi:hypothetical protein
MGRWFHLSILAFFLSFNVFAAEVAYLTDIEGSYEKLMRYLSRSAAFTHNGDHIYHLKPGAYFVFGGDATDREGYSRKILKELIRIKQEAPDRVSLIVGNRDITYIRLRDILDNFKAPVPGKRVPYFIYARMQELVIETGTPLDQISYDDAKKHLKEDLAATGLWTEYLGHAQMVARIGNTLIVHGGVNEASLGWNPYTGKVENDIDVWCKAMNQWYSENVRKWRDHEKYDGQVFETDEETLTDVAYSPLKVIFDRNVGDFNNPFLPSQATIKRLLKAGITRVIVGHTPMDQFPVVLRYQDQFEVIYADNSFAPNERDAHGILISGQAMERVDVEVRNQGTIQGVPSELKYPLQLGQGSPLGKRLEDGSLVIAPVGKGYLAFQLGEKFSAHYRVVSAAEAHKGTDPFEITGSHAGCGAAMTE